MEKVAKKLQKAGIGKIAASEHFRNETGWIIGTDESLKGDTFGGLVVAAVKADSGLRRKLVELGVADSKELSDTEFQVFSNVVKSKGVIKAFVAPKAVTKFSKKDLSDLLDSVSPNQNIR